jgi:hypothetical protein
MICFSTFSMDSKSASNSAFIDTHIAFKRERNVGVILALFSTLKANADETAEKNGKLFS